MITPVKYAIIAASLSFFTAIIIQSIIGTKTITANNLVELYIKEMIRYKRTITAPITKEIFLSFL